MTKFKTSILLSALIIACFIISIIGGVQVANAATSAYSNVMEDLNTDSKFKRFSAHTRRLHIASYTNSGKFRQRVVYIRLQPLRHKYAA